VLRIFGILKLVKIQDKLLIMKLVKILNRLTLNKLLKKLIMIMIIMILKVTLNYTSINQFNNNTEYISSSESKKYWAYFKSQINENSIKILFKQDIEISDYISTSKYNDNKESNSIKNSQQEPIIKNSVNTEQITSIQVNDNTVYFSTNKETNKYDIIPFIKS